SACNRLQECSHEINAIDCTNVRHFLRGCQDRITKAVKRRRRGAPSTMDAQRKIPTIQDVARHAKVSAATVSRVLSTPERVTEATRDRVNKAVRETGYTINQAA